MQVRDGVLNGLGYEKITAPSAATALTVPARAKYALIKTETQAVRWRAFYSSPGVASNPTTTDGMLIDIGDEFMFTGQLAAFRVIEAVAGAVVHVHYFE